MAVARVEAHLERKALATGRPSRLFVVLRITASGDAVDERPPLATALALDVSGSMAGEKLEALMLSVEKMTELARPADRIGVVAFSESATEIAPLTAMDGAGRRLVAQRVRRLAADGGTNIEAGLRKAAALFSASAERPTVILLSDGAPNRGASSGETLADVVRAFQPRISVSTLGYGQDHNEDVLIAVSEAGRGKFQFIQDPAKCRRELAQALGAQADVVIDGVEVVLQPAQGVEVKRVVGAPLVRFAAAGMIVSTPDLEDGGEHIVALELFVGNPVAASGELLVATVRYREAGKSEVIEMPLVVTVDLRSDDGPLEPEAHRYYLLARAEEERRRARALADRGDFAAAAATLRSFLREVEASPAYDPTGGELFEAHELLFDEVTAYERNPSREQYSVFRKQTVMQRLDRGAAQTILPRQGRMTQRFTDITAGSARAHALLVALNGPNAGAKYALGSQCSIGRTSNADIVITSASVSRRHAEVYALEGDYWVCDLGSTSSTRVNGQPITTAPHKLSAGDVLRIGDIELRFEWKLATPSP